MFFSVTVIVSLNLDCFLLCTEYNSQKLLPPWAHTQISKWNKFLKCFRVDWLLGIWVGESRENKTYIKNWVLFSKYWPIKSRYIWSWWAGSAGQRAVASLTCPHGRRENRLLQVVLVQGFLRENLTLCNMASPIINMWGMFLKYILNIWVFVSLIQIGKVILEIDKFISKLNIYFFLIYIYPVLCNK